MRRDIEIKPTPGELATEFCEMKSDEQARAINRIGEIFRSWGGHESDLQLGWLADRLDEDGLAFVNRLQAFLK